MVKGNGGNFEGCSRVFGGSMKVLNKSVLGCLFFYICKLCTITASLHALPTKREEEQVKIDTYSRPFYKCGAITIKSRDTHVIQGKANEIR